MFLSLIMIKRPLSIYIHIPFCIKKCDYCDFLSGVSTPDERSFYVTRIVEEIEATRPCDNYIVNTVFFGGGTPSLLDAQQIDKILCKLHDKYEFCAEPEISLECNPGTIDLTYLTAIRRLGINRISMGAQSFNDEELSLLGRIHRAKEIYEAVDAIKAAGFDNFNLDLISSIPNQDEKSFEHTLNEAIKLNPTHLSVYSLIIEEGTPFYNNLDKYKLPDEDEVLKIDRLTAKILEENGYKQYEISNYAKPGFKCQHNLTYWKRGEYRGYGLGAASLLHLEDGLQLRFGAERNKADYYADCRKPLLDRKKAEEYSVLDEAEIEFEYIMLALRMNEGLNVTAFDEMFGSFRGRYASINEQFVSEGLTEFYTAAGKEYYHLTQRGRDVANYVMSGYLL